MNRELKVFTEYYPIDDGEEGRKREKKEMDEEVKRRCCVVGSDDIRR